MHVGGAHTQACCAQQSTSAPPGAGFGRARQTDRAAWVLHELMPQVCVTLPLGLLPLPLLLPLLLLLLLPLLLLLLFPLLLLPAGRQTAAAACQIVLLQKAGTVSGTPCNTFASPVLLPAAAVLSLLQAGVVPDTPVWNSLLAAHARAGSVDAAYATWTRMLDAGERRVGWVRR